VAGLARCIRLADSSTPIVAVLDRSPRPRAGGATRSHRTGRAARELTTAGPTSISVRLEELGVIEDRPGVRHRHSTWSRSFARCARGAPKVVLVESWYPSDTATAVAARPAPGCWCCRKAGRCEGTDTYIAHLDFLVTSLARRAHGMNGALRPRSPGRVWQPLQGRARRCEWRIAVLGLLWTLAHACTSSARRL